MFQTIQNQAIEIDLLIHGNSRGWTVVDGEAMTLRVKDYVKNTNVLVFAEV